MAGVLCLPGIVHGFAASQPLHGIALLQGLEGPSTTCVQHGIALVPLCNTTANPVVLQLLHQTPLQPVQIQATSRFTHEVLINRFWPETWSQYCDA